LGLVLDWFSESVQKNASASRYCPTKSKNDFP
jgi:hypothetical protein